MKTVKWLILLTLLVSGCQKTEFVKLERPDFLSFHFFLFLDTPGGSQTASGDASLYRNTFLKLRVYDNVLGVHRFDFLATAGGTLEIIIPEQKTVLQRQDPFFAGVFIREFYRIFTVPADLSQTNGINRIELENNRISSIIFPYQKSEMSLKVTKRRDNGQPARILLKKENYSLIFDITEMTGRDFDVGYSQYQVFRSLPGEDFFDWLGAWNGGR